MPIKHSLRSVANPPQPIAEGRLPLESTLHSMIRQAPALLSPDWMLIGSEVPSHGGRLDLLATAPDASLVLIELKRDRTPREVVAQVLDYASWVEALTPDGIATIYRDYSGGRDLGPDFEARFHRPFPEEELNGRHELVIVASELDAASERIVQYLNSRGIAINVLFFRVFEHQGGLLFRRAWLVDPIETQPEPGPHGKGPWNGEFYVSYGEDASQSWAEARKFGFISASGGSWYTRTLKMLSPGSRVWVNIPGRGFVGVGIVDGPMQPLAEFTITVDGEDMPAVAALTEGTHDRNVIDDEELCAYFVPVRWLQTVPREQTVRDTGFFGNQNTVAAPRTPAWNTTVERLKAAFPDHVDHGQPSGRRGRRHGRPSAWFADRRIGAASGQIAALEPQRSQRPSVPWSLKQARRGARY